MNTALGIIILLGSIISITYITIWHKEDEENAYILSYVTSWVTGIVTGYLIYLMFTA